MLSWLGLHRRGARLVGKGDNRARSAQPVHGPSKALAISPLSKGSPARCAGRESSGKRRIHFSAPLYPRRRGNSRAVAISLTGPRALRAPRL